MMNLFANRFDLSYGGVGTFDTIVGTPDPDSIDGTTGADLIQGLGGADTLDGGKGDDTIEGGDGDDDIFGGRGHDSLSGGAGVDFIHAASGNADDDTSGDTIDGGADNDAIFGSHQADSLDGGDGDDDIFLYGGADTVHGGLGSDFITPSPGPPLTYSAGAQVFGEDGDDFIAVASSIGKHDLGGTLSGGDGSDFIQFRGFGRSDWLLDGGDGDDLFLVLGKGDDTIDGGTGVDIVDYASAGKAVTLDLSTGIATGGAIGQDTLIGIEDVVGGLGGDSMSGDAGANELWGIGGADVIVGGGGNDILWGGGAGDTITGNEGSDTMDGGGGHDTFIYYGVGDSLAADPDQIAHLQINDVIDLSAIDADITQADDQAFIRVSAFGGHAGELVLIYDSGAGRTYLEGDVDGDGSADMTIELIGNRGGFAGLVL